MRLVPLLLRDGLDGSKLFLLQSGIDAGQLFRGELLEIVDHIFQFVVESVGAGELLIGRPAFVAGNSAVQPGHEFADTLFTGDGATLLRSHNLRTEFIGVLCELLQALA